MRYISRDEIERALPDDWDKIVEASSDYVRRKAGEAEKQALSEGLTGSEVLAKIHEARAKAINCKAGETWRSISTNLASLSSGKCWYCECSEDRSDYAVDHFRPKNEVTDDPSHPGYWWLAFDWKNYRYACTYCNSYRSKNTSTEGGKQCYFPLLEGSSRACCESDNHEDIERPSLLDPLVRSDTKLITFKSNGIPAEAKAAGTEEYDRAKISIKIYHLNEFKINKSRQRIAQKITKLVASISKNRDAELEEELLSMVRPNAQYSQAARIYLRQYRDRDWVMDLLEDL